MLNTICQCNACVNINSLGLEIVMHRGEFAKIDVGGQETLSGADVVMAHRLTKNTITKKTGLADYMVVTQPCVDDLGIQLIVAGWIRGFPRPPSTKISCHRSLAVGSCRSSGMRTSSARAKRYRSPRSEQTRQSAPVDQYLERPEE